ncbi:MAG TPA: response regulator [Candidatus Binatia bacterium]|nr:response regulator [Candidatus Binatia bacterium]
MSVRSCSVLILTADGKLRETLQAMLEHSGEGAFRVEHRETLVEGLERLAAARCDALLLDLNLGDRRGLSALVEAHFHFRTLPIVVLVSRENESLGKQAEQAGALGFLVKEDLSPRLLENSLRQALNSREVPPERAQPGRQES